MKWLLIGLVLSFLLFLPNGNAISSTFIIDQLFDSTKTNQFHDGKYLLLSRQGSFLQFVRPADAYTFFGDHELSGPTLLAFNLTLINAVFTSSFPSAFEIYRTLTNNSNSVFRDVRRGSISGIIGFMPNIDPLPVDYFDFITTSFFSYEGEGGNESEIKLLQDEADIQNSIRLAKGEIWIDTIPQFDFLNITSSSTATVVLNGLHYKKEIDQWSINSDHDILNLGIEIQDYPAFVIVDFFQDKFRNYLSVFDQKSSKYQSHLEVDKVTIIGSNSKFSEGSLIPLTKKVQVVLDPALPAQPAIPLNFAKFQLSASTYPAVMGIALAVSYLQVHLKRNTLAKKGK